MQLAIRVLPVHRLAMTAMLALAASASNAAQPADCPRFLPDFHCERSGRYEGFVMPMATPYLFEDPFITTGLQTVAIWHDFPGDSVFQGGEAYVLALQLRVAITDRLAFIATKDGATWMRPGGSSQIDDEEGFFDIAAGFKYALIDRPEDDFILTPSFRIDIPVGNQSVLSGNGDGVAIPAISTAWGRDRAHLIADFGARLPFSSNKESSSLFYHAHLDYALAKALVPFVELSGYFWTKSGNGKGQIETKSFGSVDVRTAQNVVHAAGITDRQRFEGADVVNLGSSGVAGNSLITLSVGARFPLGDHTSVGAAYEFPLTHREDIFHQRATLSVLFEY